MRVAMIGSGYVGLVSGACFSEFGIEVICVDKDADKIAGLQGGEVPIYEPGLDELLERSVADGRLRFSTDLAAAVSKDPAVVQAYRDDPLVFHGTPPASRRAAMADLAEAMPGRVRAVTLPVLIMAGGASPLGDGEGSRQLYEQVSSEDKTLKLYDGLMHEIFNEPEREHVFADLLAWLEADHPSP